MEFDKYLIKLRDLFFNKNDYTLNLIEKLIYQLSLDRNYLSDTCYNYLNIKYFNKNEFSDIFKFINSFNIMNNKEVNRDFRTVLKYKDKVILFEELYVATMDCNIYMYNLDFDLSSIEYDFIVSFDDIINFYKTHIPKEISKEYYFKNISY